MQKVGSFLWELIEKIAYFILKNGLKLLKKELTDEMFV